MKCLADLSFTIVALLTQFRDGRLREKGGNRPSSPPSFVYSSQLLERWALDDVDIAGSRVLQISGSPCWHRALEHGITTARDILNSAPG